MEYLRRKRESELQSEIATLYVQYQKKLNIHVYITIQDTIIKDTCMVEDIVQDVFLEAVKKYDSFKNHPNQIGWLYQTAQYKIKEYERKLRKLNESDIEELEDVMADDNVSGYLETELKLLLCEAMTPEERLRYYRYFLWGWTIEEIAEAEGISVNNMRVKITRLKKKLLQQVNISVLLGMILSGLLRMRV